MLVELKLIIQLVNCKIEICNNATRTLVLGVGVAPRVNRYVFHLGWEGGDNKQPVQLQVFFYVFLVSAVR